MKSRALPCILTGVLPIGAFISACSGSSVGHEPRGGGAGLSATGGADGADLAQCPNDFQIQRGSVCSALAEGCVSDACVRANGVWSWASPCTCSAGFVCGKLGVVTDAFCRTLAFAWTYLTRVAPELAALEPSALGLAEMTLMTLHVQAPRPASAAPMMRGFCCAHLNITVPPRRRVPATV